MTAAKPKYEVGDVFQIIDDRPGWIGAFIMATDIKSWGIQGFVHQIDTHKKSSRAFTRLEWNQIEYIGRAVLVPGPLDVPA